MDAVVEDVSQIWPGAGGTDVVALEHVTHTFRSRRITCLLGPSGCGKSTLIQIIAGLERATSGKVRIADPQHRGAEHPLNIHSIII
jgi:NitT/TauT family transport system ATP-binding protein